MKFTEIQKLENTVVSTETATISDFQLEIINDYLKIQERKSVAKQNPFYYLYEDVISESLSFDFELVLGIKCYKSASDDAMSCITICDNFNKLSSWGVNGWLQNALKFADNIVLHYIQECLKEIPKKRTGIGVEKSRYIDLSEKDGDMSAVGYNLKDLYNLRNGLEHRTKIYDDGRQEIIRPSRNKVHQKIMKLYPDVLKGILTTYKIAFPHLLSSPS